jgi:hypothetical protein
VNGLYNRKVVESRLIFKDPISNSQIPGKLLIINTQTVALAQRVGVVKADQQL